MQVLKADTQVIVRIGPFVDSTDGVTPETGVTLGAADQAELLKHNGAATVDISASTWAAITGCGGWYDLTLTTGNTDTEGLLTIVVQDSSVCLPVFAHFMVVNANVYDSLYAAAAADYLQVDAIQISGDTQSATDLKDFADAGYDPATNKVQGVVLTDGCTALTGNTAQTGDSFARLGAPAGASVSADVAAVKGYVDDIGVAGAGLTAVPWNAAWDAEVQSECTDALNAYDPPTNTELNTAHTTTNGLITTVDTVVDAIKVDTAAILLDTGTDGVVLPQAQADKVWGTTVRTLSAAGVQAIWDALTSALTTAGSIGKKLADWVVGTIDTYTGNTKQTGDSFVRLGAPAGASVSADVAAVKADTAAILVDTGTTLEADLDAILADTNELQTDWHNGGRLDVILDGAASAGDPWITALPGAYGAGTAGKIIGDNINAPIATVDTVVDAIKAKTDNLPAAPADDTSIDSQLATIAGYLDTEVAAILAAVDTEVAAIKAKTDNLPADPASETNVNANETKLDAIDTVVDAVKVVTDKVATALELDGVVYRYTANALEQAPSGGATVGQIADAVWDEAAADHVAAGSTGKKLNDVTGGSPVNIEHDSTVIITDS